MQDPNYENKKLLQKLVRIRVKFQDMRKGVDNQAGVKATGKSQNLPKSRVHMADEFEMLKKISDAARKQEKEIEKMLAQTLKKFVFYEWLKEQKGVGPIASAWIISEFDIYKADTVSKMWSFAGLNPSMVRGKKAVLKKSYKPEMGEVIGDLSPTIKGEKRVCVLTDTMIKGDRKTPGFISPFNGRLRTALVGVLADGFIKAKSPWALEYYYPYKARLEQSQVQTHEVKKGGKTVDLEWSETTKAHRDRAAKRKMIKEFLKAVYAEWRRMEGLPVRVPYAEEYLGKKHAANG